MMQLEQLDIYSLPVLPDSVIIGSLVEVLVGNNKGKTGKVSDIYLSKCKKRYIKTPLLHQQK